MMKFHAIGLDVRHIGDFCINRPNGSGDNLLVIFKTNALLLADEKEIIVPPNSAILYTIGEKQYYRSICKNYVNHFLHFDGCEGEAFYHEAGIPFNTLMQLGNIEAVEEILKMISHERVLRSQNKDMYMDMLIRMLILKIADSQIDFLPSSQTPHTRALEALRADIYSNAGQFTSVTQLAEKLNLSSSHFQQLYKKHFGISCYEDLLTAKVKAAQYYLSSTMLSVKEIAVLCGYENDICFMRRFKKRTGLTPTEYRIKVK